MRQFFPFVCILLATACQAVQLDAEPPGGDRELASIQPVGHTDAVTALTLKEDDQVLATSGDDNAAILWDVAKAVPRVFLRARKAAVNSVAISPNERLVVAGSLDGSVVLWGSRSGRRHGACGGDIHDVDCAAFTPCEAQVAVGSLLGTVTFWNWATVEGLRSTKAHPTSQVVSLALKKSRRYGGPMFAAGASSTL
jgi:WD40 repeat protein